MDPLTLISSLLTASTSDEVFALFVQALVNLGVPANKWRPGGVFSTILRVVAITYAGFSALMVAALSAQFLPIATGNWLTLLAYYVYGVTRTPASVATTTCVLSNAGGGIYNYDPLQFTVKNAVTGVTYQNVTAIALAAAGATPATQTLQFQATVTGSAGNANPGDISQLVTTANLVSVTNPGSAVGIDQQSDPDLRTECTDALAARSVRGPRNAYRWAVTTAINPVTNAPVNINRVQVVSPGATYVNGVPLTKPATGAPGTTTIWCASPSGAPSSDDLTAAANNVEQQVRPSNAVASLLSATVVPYTRTLTVYAKALPGLAAASVQTAAAAAVSNLFATYPIGGLPTDNPSVPQGLFGTAISGAIVGSNTSAIYFVEDAANPGKPPPDQALANGQVSGNQVTLNVRMVASS